MGVTLGGILQRVIPACAGNSHDKPASILITTGHPCVCGEQYLPLNGTGSTAGSSLRVRGTAFAPLGGKPAIRVIPACAGNSR